MFQMCTTNGLIPSRAVRTRTGGEEVAERRAGRKPLVPGNFFEGTLVPEFNRQAFDESLTAEQHLSLDLFPGRPMTDPLDDKGPVLPLSGRPLSAELGQYPVSRQKRWRGDEARRRPVTRPAVGLGFAGGLGSNRVEHDIAAELQQIALAVHDDCFEPTLQHVADPTVMAIEGLGVDPVELAHGPRQIGVGRLYNQVKVVVHQAIGVQQQMKPSNDARQHIEEPLPVLVIHEDVLPGVAARGDMVERARKFKAQRSGHEAEYSSSGYTIQDLTLFDSF